MIRKLAVFLVFLWAVPAFAGMVVSDPPVAAGGGGGGPDAVDSFDRANATTITGSGEGGDTWSAGDSFSITSNELDPEITDAYAATYSWTPADADYCGALNVEAGSAGRTTPGPWIRASGGTYYHARFSGGQIEFWKSGSEVGTATNVGTPTSMTTLKFCASGATPTTLDAYWAGASTPTMTYEDSTSPITAANSAGVACLFCDGAVADVLADQFEAFDTVGP